MQSPSKVVVIPCFRRPEYTKMCLDSIVEAGPYDNTTFYLVDDGSNDGTTELLHSFPLTKIVITNAENAGLRNTLINFFRIAQQFDYMIKVDNDTLVHKGWLDTIVKTLLNSPYDIISPNVLPSNAAFDLGVEDKDWPNLRSTKVIGGLWCMGTNLLEGIDFEQTGTYGIQGAWHLLNQIILEKEPRMAWMTDTVFEDLGHWSGEHPLAIKTPEYEEYSALVGRKIAWQAN